VSTVRFRLHCLIFVRFNYVNYVLSCVMLSLGGCRLWVATVPPGKEANPRLLSSGRVFKFFLIFTCRGRLIKSILFNLFISLKSTNRFRRVNSFTPLERSRVIFFPPFREVYEFGSDFMSEGPRTLQTFVRALNRYDDVWKCVHYNDSESADK
jgi:hypothetical protein